MTENSPETGNRNTGMITISSAVISPRADKQLNPAMTAIIWQIAAELDRQGVPAEVKHSVWITVPAKQLRGPGGQGNNRWLRECLERLAGVVIHGEYRGTPWASVLVAGVRMPTGAERCEMEIPTDTVRALRSPQTFAKVEVEAAYRLSGAARRLYAALADKKRMDRNWWEYDLEDLRRIMGLEGRYSDWSNFRRRVLDPAVKGINDFGTVHVTMTLLKTGRRASGVRFAWRWKSVDEIRVTEEEGGKVYPYAESPAVGTAPPLIPETQADRRLNEEKWWNELPSVERDRLRTEIPLQQAGRGQSLGNLLAELSGGGGPADRQASPSPVQPVEMPEEEIRRFAWEAAHPDEPRYDELTD